MRISAPGGMGAPTALDVGDETDNSSDKSFTVPADEVWEIQSVYIRYTSTATVGDRRPVVNISDTGPHAILAIDCDLVFGASQYRELTFFNCGFDTLAVSGVKIYIPAALPMICGPGFVCRVWDNSAIDVNADDMYVHLTGQKWAA